MALDIVHIVAGKKDKKKQAKKEWLIVAGVLLALTLGGGLFWYKSKTSPSEYDSLAQCLTDKGVKMFGAYWCPTCKRQKSAFGNAWRYVTYVECSLPNQAGQTKECSKEGIESYPTWEFADGKRVTGRLSPEELGQQAGCEA